MQKHRLTMFALFLPYRFLMVNGSSSINGRWVMAHDHDLTMAWSYDCGVGSPNPKSLESAGWETLELKIQPHAGHGQIMAWLGLHQVMVRSHEPCPMSHAP